LVEPEQNETQKTEDTAVDANDASIIPEEAETAVS